MSPPALAFTTTVPLSPLTCERHKVPLKGSWQRTRAQTPNFTASQTVAASVCCPFILIICCFFI